MTQVKEFLKQDKNQNYPPNLTNHKAGKFAYLKTKNFPTVKTL